jgi:hypothetical protein
MQHRRSRSYRRKRAEQAAAIAAAMRCQKCGTHVQLESLITEQMSRGSSRTDAIWMLGLYWDRVSRRSESRVCVISHTGGVDAKVSSESV